MNHPLDGARLKIVRAQEHLDSLKAEVRAYLDTRPYKVILQEYADGQRYPHPVATREPPVRLSMIVGDILTNSRAALDYVMWELVCRHFKPVFNPSDFNDRRITAFPISEFATDQGHLDRLNRLANRHIPATAIDEIKAVQPYNGWEPLWWLHELVNIDKHRTVHVTATSFGNFMWVEIGHPRMVALPAFQHHLHTNPITGKDVKVETQNPVFVAFADTTMPDVPIDRTLEQIIEAVANVIPRFDSFF